MEIQSLVWINEHLHGSKIINQIFRFITYLGEDGIAWLVLGIVLLFFKKTRKAGVLLIGGFGACVILNHFILKNIFNRVRPFVAEPSLQDFILGTGMSLPSSSSFPSGHTAISITCATILIFCFKGKGAWSLIPALLISFSRIFLCVHYPTDVLGGLVEGVIIGCIVAIVGRIILNKLEKWYENKKAKKQENKDAGQK